MLPTFVMILFSYFTKFAYVASFWDELVDTYSMKTSTLFCFKINSTECYNVIENCVYRRRQPPRFASRSSVIEMFEIIDTKVHVSPLTQFQRVNRPTSSNNISIV